MLEKMDFCWSFVTYKRLKGGVSVGGGGGISQGFDPQTNQFVRSKKKGCKCFDFFWKTASPFIEKNLHQPQITFKLKILR